MQMSSNAYFSGLPEGTKVTELKCAWVTTDLHQKRRTRFLQTFAILGVHKDHVDAVHIPFRGGDPVHILDVNEPMERPMYLEGEEVMVFGSSRSDMTIGLVHGKPKRMSKIGTPGGKWLYEVKDRSTNFIHVELVDQQILPLFTPGTIVVVSIRSEERIGVIRTASYKGAAALFTVALLLWQEDNQTMTFKDEEVTPQMIRMQV